MGHSKNEDSVSRHDAWDWILHTQLLRSHHKPSYKISNWIVFRQSLLLLYIHTHEYTRRIKKKAILTLFIKIQRWSLVLFKVNHNVVIIIYQKLTITMILWKEDFNFLNQRSLSLCFSFLFPRLSLSPWISGWVIG